MEKKEILYVLLEWYANRSLIANNGLSCYHTELDNKELISRTKAILEEEKIIETI